MSLLAKLLHGIGGIAQGAEHAVGIGQPQQQQQRPQAPFAGPSASSAPIPSRIGNQYAQNPYDPRFSGQNATDPMMFGYPPDGPPQTSVQDLMNNLPRINTATQLGGTTPYNSRLPHNEYFGPSQYGPQNQNPQADFNGELIMSPDFIPAYRRR